MFLKLQCPGFNYKFNALSSDPEKNELMKAFSTLTGAAGQRVSIIPSLRAMYPALRFLVRISILFSPFYHLIYMITAGTKRRRKGQGCFCNESYRNGTSQAKQG